MFIDLYTLLKSGLPAGNNGDQNGFHCCQWRKKMYKLMNNI